MKPSEQLTDEQRKRIWEISVFHATDIFNATSVLNAIYQALDEIIPQIVKRHDYSE